MKPTKIRWLLSTGGLLAALLIIDPAAEARPRAPLPPMPERALLASLRFNSGTELHPLLSLNVKTVDSWSGYALQMSGDQPAVFALPHVAPNGKTNIYLAGPETLRLWYAPAWSSVDAGGAGIGQEATLLEVGSWSGATANPWWSLLVNPEGTAVRLAWHETDETIELLQAPIDWCAGEWHQIALVWADGVTLYLDGKAVAANPKTRLAAPSKFGGTAGFCIGSSLLGANLAQGTFEEVYSFGRLCTDEELSGDFERTAPQAAMGPITPEEEALTHDMAGKVVTPTSSTRPAERDSALMAMGDCASELMITAGDGTITLTITHAAPGKTFDLFRTFHLTGNSIQSSFWSWVASGINNQSFTFPNNPCSPVFYVLGCDQDTDGDGLTDAFELLVNKTSPTTSHTLTPLFTDPELVNVLVNGPEQDCGNEQNTQSETTVVAFNNTVVVAFVDSNLGVPGYGLRDQDCENWSSSLPPRFIGWAVSTDGGQTFVDKGAPPMFTDVSGNILGTTAGDPVLGYDSTSGIVYLAGNPKRPSVYLINGSSQHFVPLWRSTDGGQSFSNPINFMPGMPVASTSQYADKPTIVVDNFSGPGQKNVYAAVWLDGVIFVSRSTDQGLTWQVVASLGTSAFDAQLAVGPNHHLYLVWREVVSGRPRFAFAKSTDFGVTFVANSTPILIANSPTFDLELTRSNNGPGNDTFRTPVLPVLTINPATPNHLYVVYNDLSLTAGDKADILFIQSVDGGTTWTQNPIRVNSDVTTKDQWQPAITVKPDGSRLFIGWYDRRNDAANNSLIQMYGVVASLPVSGAASFAANFPISTVQFPPAFTGSTMVNAGAFDPVYPPLHRNDGISCPTFDGVYAGHMGDYDLAYATQERIFYTWADNRIPSALSNSARAQADIRLVRLPWP